MRRFDVSLLLALSALAGCAAPPPPPPVSATLVIDGTYAGSAKGSCGASAATAVVRDRRFTLTLANGSALEGMAGPDGALRATHVGDDGREMNFTGHIDGPDLRGGSYNGRCAFAFALARTP